MTADQMLTKSAPRCPNCGRGHAHDLLRTALIAVRLYRHPNDCECSGCSDVRRLIDETAVQP